MNKAKNTDLLTGSIWKSIIVFSLPLLVGNLFQQLYNTVDSYVVGNFVSSHALAAVGQSTSIINMLVGFFTGLATGAGVVISQYYGANKLDKMKDAIHTSLALTFVLGIAFTFIGIMMARPILTFIGSPKEVMPLATIYLQIYFAGVAFALIYNMGSGVLRALGDSTRPLIYLVISSMVNVVLDLVFVISFGWGVAGVAIATSISQLVSAILVMYQLVKTNEIYKVTLRKIKFHKDILFRIVAIGLPAALQNSIVSFSNVIVQSYISKFGADAVAGYSTTTKLDGFLQLPVQSFSMAITTFVGQNYGAKNYERLRKGLRITMIMCCAIVALGGAFIYMNSHFLVGLFSSKKAVIMYGVIMINVFAPTYVFLPISHVTAGALRGVGLSKVPMYSMIFCFVIIRQVYLAIATRYSDALSTVYWGWPITWIINDIILMIYYHHYSKKMMTGEIGI